MPSTPQYGSSVANQMAAAITKLKADQASGASFSQLQTDVEKYYSVQTSVRGYASLAESVVGESDYNGTVAIQNLEHFYGDGSYGVKELTVAIQLAQQDWSNITNGNYQGQALYVPTITSDDIEHNEVFQALEHDHAVRWPFGRGF